MRKIFFFFSNNVATVWYSSYFDKNFLRTNLLFLDSSKSNRTHKMIWAELKTVKISRSFERNTEPVTFGRATIRQKSLCIQIPCEIMYLRRGRRPHDHYYLSVTVTKAKRGERPSWTNRTECIANDKRVGVVAARLALYSRSLFRGWDRERTSWLIMNSGILL